MIEQIFKKQFVLGVGINDVNLDTAVEIVEQWLNKKGKHYVVTPNPEFIMAAQDDLAFKEILNKADLAIPDGVGLKLSGKIKYTTTGIDLMEALCKVSAEKGFTTGFLGGRDGVAEKAAERLQKKYAGLKVVFAGSGGEVNNQGKLLKELKLPKTDILFVAFGQLKQEKWIAQNLDKISVRVAMGVGGAFDYLSGNVFRAPKWIRQMGLEWLFRLIIQPRRIKRQFQLLRFVLLTVLQ